MSASLPLGMLLDLDAQLRDLVDLGLLREDVVGGHRCYFPTEAFDARLEDAKRIMNGGRL